MMKRILAGAAATGLALSLLASAPASAHQCTSGGTNPNNRSGDKLASTTGDGYVYGKQVGNGGYIGIQGGNGWLEANGNTGGGSIKGHSNNTTPAPEVNGFLDTARPGGKAICVNGQSA